MSRAMPESKQPGSHVLAYADKPGGTEENALYGTPDGICAKLEALQDAGAAICPAYRHGRDRTAQTRRA